jgi:trimethylamine:corrinoid methyltransferase-like protein
MRFREFWYPSLLSREIRPQWLEWGGTTLGERLRKRVLEILEEHREALAAEKKAAIDEILA